MVRVLDLFCGAGGSSHGARQAGANIVAGIDWWDTATEVYGLNFPYARALCGNVADFKPSTIGEQLGPIDLILASPPCQAHSKLPASTRAKSDDALELIRYAEVLHPRWFIVENVPQFAHWTVYQFWLRRLEDLGYHLRALELSAGDFGVSQERRRLFVLGDLEAPPPLLAPPQWGQRVPASAVLDPPGTHRTDKLFTPTRSDVTIRRANRAIAELGPDVGFLIPYQGPRPPYRPLSQALPTFTTGRGWLLVEPPPEGGKGPDRYNHRIRNIRPDEIKRAFGWEELDLSMVGVEDQRRLLGNGVVAPVMRYLVELLTRRGEER